MSSGKIPRERQAGSGGEPSIDGPIVDDASVVERSADLLGEQGTGSAGGGQHGTLGEAASRRVSAAAAAARSGPAEATRTGSPARADTAAVAAASAAAAAAVAAVSAAIAAANATTPKRAAAARPASPIRTKQVAAAAAAAGEVARQPEPKSIVAAEAFPPVQSLPAPQSLPVAALAFVPAIVVPATAVPETLLPSFPGIIRAGSSDDVPEFHPPLEPLFSNEGIVRRSEANHQGIVPRVAGVFAGVAATMATAGAALGQGIGSHLSAERPATASKPEDFGGASVVDVPTPGSETTTAGSNLGRAGSSRPVGRLAAVVRPSAQVSLRPSAPWSRLLQSSPGSSSGRSTRSVAAARPPNSSRSRPAATAAFAGAREPRSCGCSSAASSLSSTVMS
jgi:hypothetical protein